MAGDNRLFNCCTDCAEPDWSEYKSLIVAGCKTEHMDNGDQITRTADDAEAEFWTVYGRRLDDLSDAITDCKTKTDAIAVSAELSERSGLPVEPTGKAQ